MNVVINRWLEEKNDFVHPRCYCWARGKTGTVVEIHDNSGVLMARMCASCLQRAQSALNEAILRNFTCVS